MVRETKYDQVHDAQKHFRLLTDAFSRPGKIVQLNDTDIKSPANLNVASALVGFSLLNNDVSFFSAKNQEEINQFFLVNCACYPSTPEKAEFIFINGDTPVSYIEAASEGEPEYPETGANIIADVVKICASNFEGAIAIEISGPGVKGKNRVYIKGISINILECLQEKNSEFPLGVDTIITDTQGNLVALPRSAKLHW